ncbi:MAG: helicase associated domain-containing protein [Opitutales bacterium]
MRFLPYIEAKMGKRKPKKRKNKLARPPKKKAPKLGMGWESPTLPPESYALEEEPEPEPGALDAPFVPWYTPESERPFGAVDPSMHASTRYRKFRDTVAAIRETVPASRKSFATYDVPDLHLRRWLTRYCLKKEAGQLTDWQQLILEKAGFNWKRGHKPVKKKAARTSRKRKPAGKAKPRTGKKGRAKPKQAAQKQAPRHEAVWTQACEALRKVCAAKDPDSAMAALLGIDEAHFQWLDKQVRAARTGKLKPERRERLQALPFDFESLVADPGFNRWRKAFKAYAAGELKNAEHWARRQALAEKAGKLPAWCIEALNTIEFDWEKASLPPGQLNMEARWREKLKHYLELEATHGKPLPMAHPAVKPLRPWLSLIRMHYKNGRLRPELIAEFEAKGFEFSAIDRHRENQEREWNLQFAKLQAFKARFGHVRVPSSYADDPEFGAWFAHQRESWKLGKLKREKIAKFEALGVEPTYKEGSRSQRPHLSAWLKRYRKLLAFLEAEHDGRLPKAARLSQSDRSWLKRQRDKMQTGQLEPWQLEKLDAIGFNPEALPEPPPPVDWEERMERLRRYVREHGHARVARSCPDRKLYAFVQSVRKHKRQGKLSPEKERELKAAGFSFDPYGEVSPAWMRQFEALQRYRQQHGDCQVPRNYPKDQGLAEFVAQQKQRGHKGMLLAEHIRLLDTLDFPWSHGHPVAKDR